MALHLKFQGSALDFIDILDYKNPELASKWWLAVKDGLDLHVRVCR
jgi:hypothetical protein